MAIKIKKMKMIYMNYYNKNKRYTKIVMKILE